MWWCFIFILFSNNDFILIHFILLSCKSIVLIPFYSGTKGTWTEEQEAELRFLFEENQQNPETDKGKLNVATMSIKSFAIVIPLPSCWAQLVYVYYCDNTLL